MALPLGEILARINPALITRRRVQKKVEVPPDISSPFDHRNQGLIFSVGPNKPESVPAATPRLSAANRARIGRARSPRRPCLHAYATATGAWRPASRREPVPHSQPLREPHISPRPARPAPAVPALPIPAAAAPTPAEPEPVADQPDLPGGGWPEAVRQELVQ